MGLESGETCLMHCQLHTIEVAMNAIVSAVSPGLLIMYMNAGSLRCAAEDMIPLTSSQAIVTGLRHSIDGSTV